MATFLYNPDRKPKQALIAEFVVRTGIYEEIMHDLETSKMKHPEQHYLLVGQRGAGKTTLLNRIKYGVEDSAKLKKILIPVLFSEEQYHISELANLWEAVAQYLEDYQGFDGLFGEMEANASKAQYEELSYDVLEKRLRKSGKKLVLLIDNVGDLLKKMEKTEVHRLREILQTKSEIRLIAGSPFYLETVLDYQQPLFEFFKVLRLDGLNQKETQELLLKLAELNGEEEKIKKVIIETPGRVETLRTLTGGVPRTIALMYNIFVKYNDEDAVKDLEKILDAVTPLYKHRMDDLPTQQQKIMDAVAKNWDGISVKELKEKTRIESKNISAQLRQLEKNQVIEKVETSTKNHLYFLKERFFNIWYLMRYGRKSDKQRVIWLVKFLESWYSTAEIEHRIIDYVKKVKNGMLDESLIAFYGEVYVSIINLSPNIKFSLKESTPKHLSKRVTISDTELSNLITDSMNAKKYRKVIEIVKQIDDPSEELSSVILGNVTALLCGGNNDILEPLKAAVGQINAEANVELAYSNYVFLLATLSYANLYSLVKNYHEQASGFFNTIQSVISNTTKKYESTDVAVISFNLIYFLTFNQNYVVEKFFEQNPEWKEKAKAVFYTHLFLLGKKDEVLRMGSELVNKVNELVSVAQALKKEMTSIIENNTQLTKE